MPRDARAYLSDVIGCCAAIEQALSGVALETYKSRRLIRSAVEREFITIGEAISALRRSSPEIFAVITGAHRIVDFRNLLTHGYATIDDEVVFEVATGDIAMLKRECEEHLQRLS